MMTRKRGWYPVDNDDHTVRFWTGTQWIGERVWNGSEWVEGTHDAAPAQVAPQAETQAAPQPAVFTQADLQAAVTGVIDRFRQAGARPSGTFFCIVGGAVAIVLGAMLPWASATNSFISQTAKPTGGGVVLMLALAVTAVYVGFPTIGGALSTGRRVGLTCVTGAIGLLGLIGVAASFAQAKNGLDVSILGQSMGKVAVTPGAGMFVYAAGVVALGVGLLRAWIARPATTER